MKDLYIQGIFNEYMGRRDQARADLEVYLHHQSAIGEHSDIAVEIKRKLEEIEKFDSLVRLMQEIFFTPSDKAEPRDN